ncbi:adenosylcobalamin-dependent ribonucleoside-diphosphate reductase [Stetteria hydrogenophila]
MESGFRKRLVIVKRDGRREEFLPAKLYRSIRKAAEPAGLSEDEIDSLFAAVRREVEESGEEVPSWKVADIAARVMVERGVYKPEWFEAVKRYELARIYKDVYGKGGWREFSEDDLGFTFNALKVMEARYLQRDPETGRFRETPSMMIRRVARFLAKVEEAYGASPERVKQLEEEFYRIMITRRFMPNSPTLMNAGTKLGILSACFVVPVRDAMSTPEGEGIMDALRAQALIHQAGGGTGFDFSELRPEGDVVGSSGGASSGPLSFMRLFDTATDVVKQGGKRRGANMGIMHVWHPDIEKFILSKTGRLKDVNLQNFNISVGVYDEFLRAVEEGRPWPLINPRKTDLTGERDSRNYAVVKARHYLSEDWVQEVIIDELEERGGSVPLEESLLVTWDEALAIAEAEGGIVRWVDARELFNKIVMGAWDSGDPGLIFFDEVNRRHPTWYLGKIHATNPCGEEPLLDWENCNLGSINLEKYVKETPEGPTVYWEGLARDVRIAVRLLDNVIDANRHPLPQITEANRRTRKIGLGVMGWARMLIRLGIPYDSPDAVHLAWSIAEWIAWNAYDEGVRLAREKGPFPAWDPAKYRWLHETVPFGGPEEVLRILGLPRDPSPRVSAILKSRPPVDWERVKREALRHGLRNATYLSIAPTGSISIIAGASASIEPLFALAYVRSVAVGTFIEVEPLFLEELRKLEMDEPEVIEAIAETGSIAHLKWVPRRLRRLYRTAHDIDPEWHLAHQAAWQAWVDAAVSKTINLRHDEPPSTVERVYRLAWRLRLKGITVYRDRSKSQQVIYFGIKSKKAEGKEEAEPGIPGEKPALVIKPQQEEAKPGSTPEGSQASPAAPAARGEAASESPNPQGGGKGRMAPSVSRVRLGSGKVKELLAVPAEYAGGCPTCDI